jgi:hypothetical protein
MTGSDLIPYLATLAALLMLVGFTFRNQLWLRSFAIAGNLAFILYYFLITSEPLWTAIASALAIIAVNIWMMWKILKDKRSFRLNAEEMMLYARLPGLSPGQFKQLLGVAQWHQPEDPMPLTEEGRQPDALYYMLEGQVSVNKQGKRFVVGPHAFIGELAFLRGKPATASTLAQPGSLIVSWKQDSLRALMSSNDGIRTAMQNLLSADMAEKIARTAPPTLQEQRA